MKSLIDSTRDMIIIRADAGAAIGLGHMMRCLALAQIWRTKGARPIFLTSTQSRTILARLREEGMSVKLLSSDPGTAQDARETIETAKRSGAKWIILDGYHFDLAYQDAIEAAGFRILLIDDCGRANHYVADIILNQNIGAVAELYPSTGAHTRLLLGTEYALLRREFRERTQDNGSIRKHAGNVLVTLGGGDPDNVTSRVLGAVAGGPEAGRTKINVVVGAANPRLAEIKALAKRMAPQAVIWENVSDISELMAQADLAITAGGSTSWELAYMGLPSLTLVLADNQEAIAAGLHKVGATRNLGWHADIDDQTLRQNFLDLLSDFEAREKMAAAGRRLVDGRGAERVVTAVGSG